MRDKPSFNNGRTVRSKKNRPPRAFAAVRSLSALMAVAGSLFACAQASAMGLGGASTHSRIGGPLRVEIEILAEDAERIDSSCLRLAAPPAGYNEELPWLSKGKLSIDKQGNKRTLVVSNPSNNHPAIMLGIQISCGMEMRRDYTLLLNPPGGEEIPLQPVQAAASAANTRSVASPVSTRTERENNQVRTLQGDTARSIANRLYPDDTQAQRRMARALLSHNSDLLNGQRGTYNSLPAGLLLDIPPLPASLPEPATTAAASSHAESQTAPARPSTGPRSSSRPNTSRDRLIVSAGGTNESLQMSTVIGQRRELSEDQRNRLRTELQLIATLDEKISTQLELADRLRQLEALQTRLKEDADRLEAELRAQQTQAPSVSASQTPVSSSIAVATPHESSQESAQDKSAWYRNYTLLAGLGLGLAVLLGTGLWFWRRRADDRGADTLPLPDAELTGELGEHLIEPLSEADIWPDEEGHAPRTNTRLTASMEGALGVLTASGLGPASMLQILDDDVEEHDSAVELADIMMSFGRVQGAAQTLADFIRANPKQAVKPWIKLLEVYRAADMRVEYEALTAQLNKTFNVRTVGWDEFEIARQAPESLESMPHIIKRLNETWGRKECQAFLHELLRDNRQGTRQGFPLAVIDEILLLLGILESQIGPYRPEANDPGFSTQTRNHNLNASTAALSVPPIITEPPTEPLNPPSPRADKASSPSFSSSSISQLDFELDMSDLSKTLHLNLDELDADNTKDDQASR